MENYTITFYRMNCGQEERIMDYDLSQVPYIPHKKECIQLNEDVYKVKNICMVYKENIPISFEVMLQEIDNDKEWWE